MADGAPTPSGSAVFGDTTGRLAAWGLRAATALVCACAVASLSWPFGWDQGYFAWIGDIVNHGGMPYRDGWDIKGPLVYYTFALAEWVFGPTTWAIRVLDICFVAAACIVLARMTRALTDSFTARWTAVLLALWYATGTFWHTAQPDGWAGFLVLGAMASLPTDADEVRPHRAAAAGALLGLTVLLKPLHGAFLLPALLHFALQLRRTPRRLAGAVLATLGGFLVPVAVATAWFAHRDALRDCVDVYILYTMRVYSDVQGVGLGARVRGVVEFALSGEVVAAALAPAAYGFVVLWRRSRDRAWEMASWIGVALAIVVVQGRFYDYQWLPIHAPIALLAAVGLHHAATSRAGSGLVAAVFVVLVFHAAVHPSFEVLRWAAWKTGLTDTDAYYDGFGVAGAERRAARHIEERTTSDDEIAIWGWNTSIAYMSRRRVVSRFGYSMPLLMGGDCAVRRAYRAEFLDAVRRSPPAYVVNGPQSQLILGGKFDIGDFPEFAEFVARRYVEEARFGDLRVLRLASGGGGGGR